MAKRNPPCGGGGGGSTGVIQFTILAYSPTLAEIDTSCDFVSARVDLINCDNTSVAVGDEVTVWDYNSCYFKLPVNLLVGARGRAELMKNPLRDYPAGAAECLLDITQVPCMWVVSHMTCCVEETYVND